MDKNAFLALAATHYDELAAVGQAPDFYPLEATFDRLVTEFGRQVLEQTLGPVPANAQKKTSCGPASAASK